MFTHGQGFYDCIRILCRSHTLSSIAKAAGGGSAQAALLEPPDTALASVLQRGCVGAHLKLVSSRSTFTPTRHGYRRHPTSHTAKCTQGLSSTLVASVVQRTIHFGPNGRRARRNAPRSLPAPTAVAASRGRPHASPTPTAIGMARTMALPALSLSLHQVLVHVHRLLPSCCRPRYYHLRPSCSRSTSTETDTYLGTT